MNKSIMKKRTTYYLLAILLGMILPVNVSGAESADTLFLKLSDGGIQAFPKAMIKSQTQRGSTLTITTIHGKTYEYVNAVESDENPIKEWADITEFKFNNKYNDQLHTDVFAEIGANTLTAKIGAIGKWLTPSFVLSTEDANLYLNNEKLVTRESRRSYANAQTLTVAKDNHFVYDSRLIKPAVYSDVIEETTAKKLNLTADMFSTNAPSGRDEGPDKLIDGDPNTYFHSTWDGDPEGYTPLPYNRRNPSQTVWPYLSIQLPEQVSNIQLYYLTRGDVEREPWKFELQASKDGENWTSIRVFADELPHGTGQEFLSDVIALGDSYGYLRLNLQEAANENYFVLAELAIYSMVQNDPELVGTRELISEEVVETGMFPLGHNYTTDFTWLTDGNGVPKIYINTLNGKMIGADGKDVYYDATIRIDGSGVFDNLAEMAVTVKGRGNSSWDDSVMWGEDPKNPYRLKFEKGQKPLGMTKGKSWVLLANKQDNSMISNPVGMKIARLVGTEAANQMTPVDLYVNGDYRGSYVFTPKVGISGNSIDLDDETYAVLLEMDTYYDELYRFYVDWDPYDQNNPERPVGRPGQNASINWNKVLPFNVKDPDLDEAEEGGLTLDEIKASIVEVVDAIRDQDAEKVASLLDLDVLARYLMVNELICNFEVHHPKSTYLYNPNLRDSEQKWLFGPVWDLDWAYGYEKNRNYGTYSPEIDFWTGVEMENSSFMRALRGYDESGSVWNEALDKAYYRVWHKFMEKGQLEELIDFCDDYNNYAKQSFQDNADKWGDGNDYDVVTANTSSWLEARANYIYENLTPYELDDDDEEETEPTGVEKNTPQRPQPIYVDVFDLSGRCVARQVKRHELRSRLSNGVYVINGKKFVVR